MRSARLCFALTLLFTLVVNLSPPVSAADSSLIPLPRRCGGFLPPDAGAAACCLFGYVFIDGKAVEGARVTLSTPRGSRTAWTERASDSPSPYYSTDLSSAPLSASPGDTVTVTVDYGGHTHTISHTVLSGGQQVDLVIPLGASDGYVIDRQFWKQAEAGQLNQPAGIIADPSGAIYVVDRDNARVQVYVGDGILLPSRGWGTRGGGPGQFVDPRGIAVDRQGDLYVADSGNHRIQKFSATGEWKTMWGSFGAGALQFKSPRSVAIAANGDIFIADTGNGRIQQLNRNGTLLGSIDRPDQGGAPFFPLAVALDGAGNLYVSAGSAYDIDNDIVSGPFRVQRGRPGGSWEVLSSGGQFNLPQGLSLAPDGSLLVADSGNSRIQRRSNAAGAGSWTTIGAPGASPGEFSSLESVAAAADGTLLVADTENNRVQRIRADGAPIAAWGVRGSTSGQFNEPTGLAVDNAGNLYVADTSNYRVQKLAPSGEVLAIYDDRDSAPGGFNLPLGVALDSAGNLYVTDTNNNRVQVRNAATGQWTAWGSFSEDVGGLFFPSGIAIGPDNLVYVAEMDRNRVQRFTQDGQWRGFYGKPNNLQGAAPGEFNGPRGLAFDRDGNLYVTERYSRRVQRRAPDGTWTIIRDNSQPGAPDGVATDATGNVYLAMTCTNRIIKLTGNGSPIASWGREGNLEGEFRCPAGVVVAADGTVYVADTAGNRIQRFRPLATQSPVATIVLAGPLSVTAGTPVRLVGRGQDSQSPPSMLSYEWRLNDTSAPFETAPEATLSTAGLVDGVYNVSLLVRSANGRSAAVQRVSITVGRGVAPVPTTPTKWGMLLYLAGDNVGTSTFMDETTRLGALWRLARAGPNDSVSVAALMDGPASNDTRRALLRPDGSFILESVPEANMGDPQTLVEFARWGIGEAKADRYYLAIADHADALDGIAFDLTSGPTERLTNAELRAALSQITEGGARPIDVLHLDGCLMGTVENAYQVRGVARTLVASANLGWSAFAYEEYRTLIGPDTSADSLARSVARRYASLMQDRQVPFTITALNLATVDTVAQRVAGLTDDLLVHARLAPANRTQLLAIRRQTQKYDSNGNIEIQEGDAYIDIVDWAGRIEDQVADAGVKQAARDLLLELGRFQLFADHASGVVTTEAGRTIDVDLDDAHSLGIFYPPAAGSRTYQVYVRGLDFPAAMRWDSLLAESLTALPPVAGDPEVAQIAPLPFERVYHVRLPLLRR